jgi:ABC-2 type transport system ATP-binding protein
VTDYAIRTDGLRQKLGSAFEVHDLALRVPTGSVYGFLGPNGAGKTSTIRMLTGLKQPDAGRIELCGYDIATHGVEARLRTGYVPERSHVYPMLSVREAMAMHAAFWHRTWDSRWAEELRATFGLNPATRVDKLSKGENGKLLMLLALAQRPDLLILDEPTDGLDPVARRDVLEGLLAYVADTQATVFISSHLVHELERICDWVGVLSEGRLVAELPMQVFKDGLKRLRVKQPPAVMPPTPFHVLARAARFGTGEEWVVRGWQGPMTQWFDGTGCELVEVVDLDLEEGFVELLRASRVTRGEG